MTAETFTIDIAGQQYNITARHHPANREMVHEVWQGDWLLFMLLPGDQDDGWKMIPGQCNADYCHGIRLEVCNAIEAYWL